MPGDDIIGFVTRGYGVSIHKRDCTNVPEDITACEHPERWVNAYWLTSVKENFQSSLRILGNDRAGLLADVSSQLSGMHIMIRALDCRELPDNKAIINVTLDVSGLDHLKSVMARLGTINGIISITRE